MKGLLNAMFEDDTGHVLMDATRMGMGMSLEQAKMADAGNASWI